MSTIETIATCDWETKLKLPNPRLQPEIQSINSQNIFVNFSISIYFLTSYKHG
jgi:hypothetical protein